MLFEIQTRIRNAFDYNNITIKGGKMSENQKTEELPKKDYLSMSWVDKFNGKMLYNDKKIYYKLNFN